MQKKIKILFLINTFKRGGSTRVFLNQINALHERGYDVYLGTVINFNKGAAFLHELKIAPEKIEFFIFRNIGDVSEYLRLKKFIKDHNIGFVYSTMDLANIVARALKIFCPFLRVVIRESGMADRKGAGTKLLDICLNFLADRIIAQTEDLKKSLLSYQSIHGKKIKVLGNGVVIRDWDWIIGKRAETKKDDEYIILNIGTMRGYDKGQKELLEIFAELALSMPNKKLKLIMVGDGVLRKQYEEFVGNNNLDRKVLFTGKVDYKEIIKYYLMSDVYVTLSKTEGFSNTVLEAMSFCLPVISTRVSGAIGAIENGKSGFLVDVGDKRAVYNKIKQLMNEPSLGMSTGQNAYARVKEFYSLENNVQKLENIFQGVGL